MKTSLKDDNRPGLYSLMTINLVVFYAVIKSGAIVIGDWVAFAKEMGDILPAGIGIILTGIINAQFSSEMKARIVFLRWNNALPGCEAFTTYAISDPRVNVDFLKQKYGPLPIDPREQNVLWYRFYKSIETEQAVEQAHRAFLFARDYASLAFLMTIILGGIGFLRIFSIETALIYFAILGVQFVVAGQAARNHGKRLVATVLALKGSGR